MRTAAKLKARREAQSLREVTTRIDHNPGMLSLGERGLRTVETWEAGLYLGACPTPMHESLRIISLFQPPSDQVQYLVLAAILPHCSIREGNQRLRRGRPDSPVHRGPRLHGPHR
ncbi:hypothetical protein [Amycolatopsis sp. NPDC058986]|uniref:hypothetical protein n=1 Tax=unclassified Amycolatopsis TaxID=2618356 RepID=UPI00366BF2D9